MNTKTGTCLCGKIAITVPKSKKTVGACHCVYCRKWAGGPFLALDCGTDIEMTGEEHLGFFASSDWGERAFCKNCGSSLFFRLKDKSFYSVSSEIFNDKEHHFESQIFIDAKPEYYSFANETKNLTGEQLFALFAPKD